MAKEKTNIRTSTGGMVPTAPYTEIMKKITKPEKKVVFRLSSGQLEINQDFVNGARTVVQRCRKKAEEMPQNEKVEEVPLDQKEEDLTLTFGKAMIDHELYRTFHRIVEIQKEADGLCAQIVEEVVTMLF